MASLNKVMIIGNLGSDPEVRTLPSGGKVVNFSVATSESYTNKSGEKVENTEWHRVELWDNLAGIAEQYLKKGDPVFIEGRIRTEKWTDQSGAERYTTKIRANGMQLLGSRGSGNVGGSDTAPAYTAPPTPKAVTPVVAPAPEFAAGGGDDDLPF